MARHRRPRGPASSPRSGANRAGQQLPPGRLRAALDRAGVTGVRLPWACASESFASRHDRFLPLRLSFSIPTRLDDRNDAAVSFHDDRLTEAWTFRKFQIRSTGFEHRLGMGERDPLDRALPNLEAVMLPQLASNLREGLIGGEVDDDALQGARTARGADFRAAQKRAHTLGLEPILRLLDLYLAEFRMLADFFSPWRCI